MVEASGVAGEAKVPLLRVLDAYRERHSILTRTTIFRDSIKDRSSPAGAGAGAMLRPGSTFRRPPPIALLGTES